MMRSLYSGVAGLKTHQTRMDVIGNNIANVNTVAFKSSSMTFSELMSQTTQKASGPNATTGTGGVNARQIGLGVKGGAININITGQGSAQSTGNPFDIMITGENFFVVNNGRENFFTRDGSFYVDGAGNLAMTSTGYNVMGWQVDEETMDIKQDTVSALRIMSEANMTYPPEATSKAYIAGILDQNDSDVTSASGKSINLNFYDALGYSYTAKFTFMQSDDPNTYSVELSSILDSAGNELELPDDVDLFGTPTYQEQEREVVFNSATYVWDATGKILSEKTTGNEVANVATIFNASTTPEEKQKGLDAIAAAYGFEGSTDEFLSLHIASNVTAGDTISVEAALEELAGASPTFETTDANNNGVLDQTNDVFPSLASGGVNNERFTACGREYSGSTIYFNPNNGYFNGIGTNDPTSTTANLNLSLLSGNFSNIEIDFSTCSGFDNKGTSTIGATSGDADGIGSGRRLGDMIGVSVQNNGMIYASYDNGMTKLLGQIASASFANAAGLEKQGDNLYSATLNSGEFDGIGVDITANGGYMSTGQLEMSNVDLSAEFTEMITTQRGFQANSRIITVSDTMLEELTNLKR